MDNHLQDVKVATFQLSFTVHISTGKYDYGRKYVSITRIRGKWSTFDSVYLLVNVKLLLINKLEIKKVFEKG